MFFIRIIVTFNVKKYNLLNERKSRSRPSWSVLFKRTLFEICFFYMRKAPKVKISVEKRNCKKFQISMEKNLDETSIKFSVFTH